MSLRHHSLIAWQRADDLFITVHRASLEHFPAREKYELGSQLRRAAYSVPANIVEGFASRYRGARLRYLNVAEASLAEVAYCLHVARRLGYISDDLHNALEIEIKTVSSPLVGLVRSSRLMAASVWTAILALVAAASLLAAAVR